MNLYFFLYDIVIFRCIKLFHTHTLYVFNERSRRTVKNREFGTVNLHEAVVYSQSVKRSHGMFNGRTACVALGYHCAARSFHYVFGNSRNYRFTFKIYSLYFVSGVLGCGIESNSKVQTRMQSFSVERETAVECCLFKHDILIFLCFRFFVCPFPFSFRSPV